MIRLTVGLSDGLHEYLSQMAEDQGRSIADVVRDATCAYMEANEPTLVSAVEDEIRRGYKNADIAKMHATDEAFVAFLRRKLRVLSSCVPTDYAATIKEAK